MKTYFSVSHESLVNLRVMGAVKTLLIGLFLMFTHYGFSQEKKGPSKIIVSPNDNLLALYANSSQGDTVFLSEGVYNLPGQLVLKKGVNLMGAGPDKTILTTDAEHLLTEAGGNTNWDKYLISKYEPSSLESPNLQRANLFIEGFSIKSTTTVPLHGGIGIQNQANLEVRNVRVEGTYWSGLNILFVHKAKVSDSEFIDCGRFVETEVSTSTYGVVNIGSSEKLVFQNNRVLDNRTLPNNTYILSSLGSNSTEWVDVSLTDNYFRAQDQRSIWSQNGQAAPTYWKTSATKHFGTEIRNNYFGVPISITQERSYNLGYHEFALQFTNNVVSTNSHLMELTLPNTVNIENVIWETPDLHDIGPAIVNFSSSVRNKLSVNGIYTNIQSNQELPLAAYQSQAGESAEVSNLQSNHSKEDLKELAAQWGIKQ
ncbi:MAG: hypothetical protein AAF388_20265 [Bacteroidota bacterium]